MNYGDSFRDAEQARHDAANASPCVNCGWPVWIGRTVWWCPGCDTRGTLRGDA